MKVINLFAGPGAGKSTTAAGLFHLMKLEGMNVELVTEYAKEMTWEKRNNILTDELYIFAKQHRRVRRLMGEVEYVVTDSPILLCIYYRKDDYSETFDKLVLELWNRYENLNFFVERAKPYVAVGRSQSEDEARAVDGGVKALLAKLQVPFEGVPGDAQAPARILARVKELSRRR
ncbi:MAG: AAA family ATPase [Planctomycetes bacterium]|nr:AAA family ATPase [Planctomycetota bacterium]